MLAFIVRILATILMAVFVTTSNSHAFLKGFAKDVGLIKVAEKPSPEMESSKDPTQNDKKEAPPEEKKEYTEAAIKSGEIDKKLLSRIQYQVYVNNTPVKDYKRNYRIIMGEPEDYQEIRGVTCFRGNNYRDSASFGRAKIVEKKLEIVWSISVGAVDSWSGVGWNGQPAIVEWPEDMKANMNISPEKKKKAGLKEVLYAALDGKVYFLDLEDGKSTRPKIEIPGPVKGSLSVDPRGIPLLYVGQGINVVHGKTVEMGYRIFSLIDQKKLFFINGSDGQALRKWPAFDSTALIHKESDTMILGGENGIFYTAKLNSNFNKVKNTISVKPEVVKYRYKISGNNYQGIENSTAVYRNLAYFTDNGGGLQCVDLNTMKPMWVQNVTDDTDSTTTLEEENGGVSLYTGCEVDKQGSKGYSHLRKIDGLSGKILWEVKYTCESKLGDHPNNGGLLATPVIGKNNISNMVIFNLARFGGFSKGLVVALDKKTGKEIWRLPLNSYSWSSPVAVYNEEGEAYIIQCDSAGNMFLIEGRTGKVLDKAALGSNVEASPAVFENMAVVGTRGQKIFGVKIK